MRGNITRRGKNSWRLKFDIGADAEGKRRSRFHTVKGSRRDAEIKLALLIAENARGEYVDSSKIGIAEFVERWLRDWAQSHVSAKTFERYAELLRNHVARHIGKLPLQKLRAIDINELYGTLLQGPPPLAPRTVGHVHRALRRALGHAHRWGLVHQNVAALVTPPRVAATEIEILAPDRARALLQKLEGHSIYPLSVLALATGMRRGELLALRWRDVDLDGAVLRVEQSLEETTKTGLPVLRAHWKAQQELRLRLGQGKASADALVFGTWQGKARSPNSLTKEWRAAVKTAEMPAVTLHSLRHTYASYLIAAGHDVLTISRRMGHGSPTITLGVYGHLFPNTDDRAAASIEAMFT